MRERRYVYKIWFFIHFSRGFEKLSFLIFYFICDYFQYCVRYIKLVLRIKTLFLKNMYFLFFPFMKIFMLILNQMIDLKEIYVKTKLFQNLTHHFMSLFAFCFLSFFLFSLFMTILKIILHFMIALGWSMIKWIYISKFFFHFNGIFNFFIFYFISNFINRLACNKMVS